MNTNQILIKDLENNDKVEWFYMIKTVETKLTTQNKEYLSFVLQDNSGEISAKLWNLPTNKDDFNEAGKIVKIRAIVDSWQDKLQLKIEKIRLANANDPIDISQLIPCAPIHPDDMYKELIDVTAQFEDIGLKKIVMYFLEKYKEKLLYYPAAKQNHHAIFGGLLYHIKRMLNVGQKISEVYPHINKELLYSGIILHDIEKINEMDATLNGIVTDYTREGKLLGHISTGIVELGKIELDEDITNEKILLLQHMILSHHYKPEYGSPKQPMFIEAELLHHIDNIDAKVFMFQKETDKLKPNEFSQNIWNLDKRKLYKSTLNTL